MLEIAGGIILAVIILACIPLALAAFVLFFGPVLIAAGMGAVYFGHAIMGGMAIVLGSIWTATYYGDWR